MGTENYLPILGLCPCFHSFRKLLISYLPKRLDSFINKHGLINNCEYGFRSNRSTSLALYKYI